MRTMLLLVLSFFAAVAQAAWTDAERAELRKIVETGVLVQELIRQVSTRTENLENPKESIPALSSLVRMSWYVRNAFDCATGVTGGSGCGTLPRPRQIEKLYGFMDRGVREHQRAAITRLRSLGHTDLASRLAVLPIDSFDRKHAYLDFRPESYPNVVGPHGDFDRSMSTIQHAVEYVHHTQHDMVRLWQNTNGSAKAIAGAFYSSGAVLKALWRAWAINADVALEDDVATALRDAKHGSGLRPPGFFLALIAVEYTFGRNHVIFSEREGKRGATVELRAMVDRFTTYLSTLPQAELAQQFAPGSGHNFGAGGKKSWARNFYLDLSDFWVSLDQWGANFMLFFRAPPAPVVAQAR